MASKQQSGSPFSAKRLGLALALLIIVGVLVYLQNKGFDSGATSQQEEKSVSKGLSAFYRDFRASGDTGSIGSGDFVVDLPASSQTLDQRLQNSSGKLRPAKPGWVGEHKHRSFKAGNTLRQAISDFAAKEGMSVVWDLDQDFVIKHQFQMSNTLAEALSQIGSAVNSNFESDVYTYVCSRQRSLVVTATQNDFVKKNCTEV